MKTVIVSIKRLRQIDLEAVHFCKSSKAKYRIHLTVGMLVATAACFASTIMGHEWLMHLATTANAITALIWIWE